MKSISTIIVGVCLLSLTACDTLDNWNDGYLSGGKYLVNDQGLVSDCRGNHLSVKHKPSEADQFWQNNNLPRGTKDFVCKDGQAYLPNKVTDCQGNLIAKQSGGIRQFKINNNFPRYASGEIVRYTAFECEGSNLIPIDRTKKYESA